MLCRKLHCIRILRLKLFSFKIIVYHSVDYESFTAPGILVSRDRMCTTKCLQGNVLGGKFAFYRETCSPPCGESECVDQVLDEVRRIRGLQRGLMIYKLGFNQNYFTFT